MTDDRIASLRHAVRLSVVGRYCAFLLAVLGGLNTVSVAVAWVSGETAFAVRLAVVCGLFLAMGLAARRISPPRHLQLNEALTVVALMFCLAPPALAWPLSGADIPFIDAWFESVSGLTTTGLTTLATVEDKSRAFLFHRAFMQWYGALGIVVLSVALLMHNSVAARRLIEPEASGETLLATTQAHARRVLSVYVLLTALILATLWLVLGDGFNALAHTLTAVSTGGFSTFDDSLAGMDTSLQRYVVMATAVLGAFALPWYYTALHGQWRRGFADEELRAFLLALVVSVALFTMLGYWAPESQFAQRPLVALSAQTGTGFSNIAVGELDSASKMLLLVSMGLGGCVGSTTGGLKMLRLLLLLRLVQLMLQRASVPPHAVVEPRLEGRRVALNDMLRAVLLVVLFLGVTLAAWLMFLLYGHAPLDALFEVVSATATVGLSTGLTEADLAAPLKLVLMAAMIAGRVEVLALLVVLYPPTWFGKRMKRR